MRGKVFSTQQNIFVGQWVSVEDELPMAVDIEDDQSWSETVLIYTPRGASIYLAMLVRYEYGHSLTYYWEERDESLVIDDVTHWMLLPDPPGETGNG